MITRTVLKFAYFFSTAIVLGLIAAMVKAQSAPSNCDDIQLNDHPRIQPYSTVSITAPTNLPSEYRAGLEAAITEVSNTVDGISFVQTLLEPEDGASIIVSYPGSSSEDVGTYSGNAGSNGYLRAGTLSISPGVINCGPGASSLCLDPSNPAAYQAAIKYVFLHELMHALGAGHSQQQNLMNAYFYDVNNAGNTNMGLACVLQRLRRLLAKNPSGPIYTCRF